MPLPRFHIRTLMIAVASVGIGLWAGVSFPDIYYAIAVLAVPLLGACWGGIRSADSFDGSVVGGIAGGIIQVLLLAALSVVSHPPLSPGDCLLLAAMVFGLSLVSVALGSIAGLFVGIGVRLAQAQRRQTPG